MARPKKYVVRLTEQQGAFLRELVRKGTSPARVLTRARILLLASEEKPNTFIAEALQVSTMTVTNVCRRFVQEGLERALYDRPRPGGKPKLDAKGKAMLIALACSEPPEGRTHWTMQLLADRLVALHVVDSISDETVRRVLKKTNSNHGKRSSGV